MEEQCARVSPAWKIFFLLVVHDPSFSGWRKGLEMRLAGLAQKRVLPRVTAVGLLFRKRRSISMGREAFVLS